MQKKYWKNLKIFKTTNPEPRSLKAFSFFMFIKNFIYFGFKFIISNVVFMFLKS